jgi:hypothetical protein
MQFVLRASQTGILVAITVGLFMAAGCGSAGPVSHEVKGQVTFQGQPVTEGRITFEDAASGFANSASLDATGAFTLALQDGNYQVSIEPPLVQIGGTPDTPPDEGYKEVDNIPEQYRRADTSGLTAQVGPGKTEHRFDMTP